MRFLLMIHNLGVGGAERVLTLVADELAARGHEVYLITLTGIEDDFFKAGERVRRIRLNIAGDSKSVGHGIYANLRRVWAIRRQIRVINPNAVLSFTTAVNVLALLACSGLNVPVVVSERVDPRGHIIQRRWQLLRKVLYRRARTVVVQTDSAAASFRKKLSGHVSISVIENPVVVSKSAENLEISVPIPFILAAGRLVHQKGFDILIEAFYLIARKFGKINLVIAGVGPEADMLMHLVSRRGLDDRVHFLGRVKALGALMKKAHAFALSSRYEGFPNVLVEALALGLPVVSTDCLSGPREILGDGKYGLLVPPEDPSALAKGMMGLITDAELRNKLSMAGRQRAEHFRRDAIVTKWEDILCGRRTD